MCAQGVCVCALYLISAHALSVIATAESCVCTPVCKLTMYIVALIFIATTELPLGRLCYTLLYIRKYTLGAMSLYLVAVGNSYSILLATDVPRRVWLYDIIVLLSTRVLSMCIPLLMPALLAIA